MNELEVVLLKLIIPSRLASIDFVRFAEEGKVLMICPDFEGFFGTDEVMTPFLKSCNNRK